MGEKGKTEEGREERKEAKRKEGILRDSSLFFPYLNDSDMA